MFKIYSSIIKMQSVESDKLLFENVFRSMPAGNLSSYIEDLKCDVLYSGEWDYINVGQISSIDYNNYVVHTKGTTAPTVNNFDLDDALLQYDNTPYLMSSFAVKQHDLYRCVVLQTGERKRKIIDKIRKTNLFIAENATQNFKRHLEKFSEVQHTLRPAKAVSGAEKVVVVHAWRKCTARLQELLENALKKHGVAWTQANVLGKIENILKFVTAERFATYLLISRPSVLRRSLKIMEEQMLARMNTALHEVINFADETNYVKALLILHVTLATIRLHLLCVSAK